GVHLAVGPFRLRHHLDRDVPVRLEAVQGRVDLADVQRRAGHQLRLVGRLQAVAVQRPLRQQPQDRVLDGQRASLALYTAYIVEGEGGVVKSRWSGGQASASPYLFGRGAYNTAALFAPMPPGAAAMNDSPSSTPRADAETLRRQWLAHANAAFDLM